VLAGLVAMLAAATIAACGSAAGGSTPAGARRLLQQTFDRRHTVSSGVLSFRLTLAPAGSSSANNPLSLSLSGPFQSRGAGRLPESNLTVGLAALGRQGKLGVISTGTSAYVTLAGTAYRLPAAGFQNLVSGFTGAGAGGSGLSQLGIDPLSWLENASVVGTENIAGTSTTHIRATVDVGVLLAELDALLHKASSSAGSATLTSIAPATRRRIVRAVAHPVVDVWTGSSDHTLRKLSLSMGVRIRGQVSRMLGGLTSAALGMTFQYADLNRPQTITAPANAQPFSGFQSRLPSWLAQVGGG
jgi:hypothetical protein